MSKYQISFLYRLHNIILLLIKASLASFCCRYFCDAIPFDLIRFLRRSFCDELFGELAINRWTDKR